MDLPGSGTGFFHWAMLGFGGAIVLVWVAIGIIVGFLAWAYIQPMLPAKTTA